MIRLLVALALAASGAGAQAVPESLPPRADSALEARTSAVAAQLRCPVCQGVSIQDSPAELAQQMRGVVRDQLAAGRTPEQVKAYFISKYGEWILLEPEARGFNLLAYGLPALLIVVGLGVVATVVRRNSARTAAPSSGAVGVDEEP